MYFFLQKGRQILDMRGDLVLTHNPRLIVGRVRSAAPRSVRNGQWVEGIAAMSTWRKIKASAAALRFIWGRPQLLDIPTAEVKQ